MNPRVGLIGYGGWTRMAYVPALRRDGRARIVSAAAPSEATQQRIRAELGDEVAVFASAADLLSGPPVDAVFIAVPDDVHEEALNAALDAGVAIFYEPPVANERQRIRPMLTRLLDASQVAHADLEIGFIPVFVEAARRVQAGILGQVRTARIHQQSNWAPMQLPVSAHSTISHPGTWMRSTAFWARRPGACLSSTAAACPDARSAKVKAISITAAYGARCRSISAA